MACCKCNKTGKCLNCICRRSGRKCSNFQPGSLSKFTNDSNWNGNIPDANSNDGMSLNGDDLSSIPNDPIPAEDTSSHLLVTTNPVLCETTCPTAAKNTPFLWGSLDGDEFKHKIEEIYEVVVCGREICS